MAYTNHLLFNNVFLKNLQPPEEVLAAARYLVHQSARDWYRNADLSSPNRTVETWLQPLLNQQSLDLIPCDEGTPHAWFIVAPWDRATPLALCYVAPEQANLDGAASDGTRPKGQHWMIDAVNLTRSLPEHPLRWAVLTNGVQWRLLDTASPRRYEAYLEVDLYRLLAGEDDALAAYLFYHLFRYEDAFERDETGESRLDEFLERSIQATRAVEVYLKTAVSDNLNTPGGGDGIMAQLCMGLVRAIDPGSGKTFSEQERAAIYRDATYLLYRLLFILYAEARGLLPMERADYRAVSLQRLVDEAARLRQNPGLPGETSTALWRQLDTLFNAIHYSDEYLGIPPYNGGLFDNKDKPYLSQMAIADVYLAEALYELAYLPDPKGNSPAERIDYRDLSVRHLGSLYEGMIEYQLFIAEETLLARRDKDGKVKYLPRAQNEPKPNDEVVKPGKVYFAQSPHERKATGTHYTPEDLVTRLVKQTVERLLEERWAAFEPQFARWLNEVEATPDVAAQRRLQQHLDSELEAFVYQQVLSLRICDPAMGSGHFLVHIAHKLTAFALHTLSRTPWENPAVNLDAEVWRRRVVEHCLYGVDINEMAVELAKLSLWLATMQLGRPLSFLDHHLKRGNSLLGVDLEEITAILENSAFNMETRQKRVAEAQGQCMFQETPRVHQKLAEADALLQGIAARQVERVSDVETQEADYATIRALLAPYQQIGDLLVARKMGWKVKEAELRSLALALEAHAPEMLSDGQRRLLTQARDLVGGQDSLHWTLEFPQVFLRAGEESGVFNVVIGNPPFLGGKKIRTELGENLVQILKTKFPPAVNTADLCAYFFRLGFELTQPCNFFGFVATNTIAQGDTRETGLSVILDKNARILYADRYVTWGGEASVEVNLVSIRKDATDSCEIALLDGAEVPFISSRLDDLPNIQPSILVQNQMKSFIGDFLRGKGFLVCKEKRDELLLVNRRNPDCVKPYLVGADLNDSPNQEAGRYVICFEDWELERALDYPELIQHLRVHVKPERDKVGQRIHRDKWWLFAGYKKDLRYAAQTLRSVLVRSRVSEYHMLVFSSKGIIFGDALVIFAYDDYYHFALLQSHIHEVWLRRQSSTLESRNRYTPTDCFQTFPFPQTLNAQHHSAAEQVGRAYYEHRQQVMQQTQLGLTKTYNRFHDLACQDTDIAELRRLHAEMDCAVLACYGWEDIPLQHDFYPNDRKKIRFMPSREAQRELFTRLLALNQEIAAQEAVQGLVAETGEEEDEVEDAEQSYARNWRTP